MEYVQCKYLYIVIRKYAVNIYVYLAFGWVRAVSHVSKNIVVFNGHSS